MIRFKYEALLLFRKFLTSKVPITKIRNLSTEKVPDDVGDEKTSETPAKDHVENNVPDELKILLQHFHQSTDYADRISEMPSIIFKKRKSRPGQLYLLQEEIADDFVDLIKDNLVKNPWKIIEVNAGAGILTERLLAAGVPELTIMETKLKCIRTLARLQQKYPNRLSIQEADLFDIWRIAYQDKHDGAGRVAEVLGNFPQLRWGEKLGLQIIGAMPNINFVRHLILDVVRQSGIVACGRPCLYLCLPPSVWQILSCDQTSPSRDYRAMSVLFQLFFNYEKLGEFPRKAFLPWPPNYSQKQNTETEDKKARDREYMYVARIEGKENLFTDVIDEALIQPMWYFITHHMLARSGRVIPQMEVWSPGCGPKLIMKDHNIFTQFGDLSPQQILQLFKDFTLWDGYQNSFIPAFENSTQKLEQLTF